MKQDGRAFVLPHLGATRAATPIRRTVGRTSTAAVADGAVSEGGYKRVQQASVMDSETF